ncbi:MAG: hypothetical protein JNL42_00140 [Anaerolineae bacterium]|nr:hypothetical protein [Anaerolineae bacterium]
MEDFAYFLLIASPFGAAYLWIRWYLPFFSDRLRRIRPNPVFVPMMIVPLLCTAIIFLALKSFAASDVRDDSFYLPMYLALGLAWIGVGEWLFRLMGISAIFDVLERANRAAFFAVAGALFGLSFCYSGGNIGEGPGTEAVLYAAGLATIAYAAVWWVYATLTQIDYAVTMHRDDASGVRLGGFLMAAGLILGRAAAGNWVSYAATFVDLIRYGAPVLLLLLAAVVLEPRLRPTADAPARSVLAYGVLPAMVFVTGAIIYLVEGTFPL